MGELAMGSLSLSSAKSNERDTIATFQPAGVAAPFEVRIQSAASALNAATIRVDALGNISLLATARAAAK